MPNRPGTWFSIIAAWRAANYKKYLPTCFSVINDLAIWIKVRHVRSANPLKDWHLVGAAIMMELFESIYWREFQSINFLSK